MAGYGGRGQNVEKTGGRFVFDGLALALALVSTSTGCNVLSLR